MYNARHGQRKRWLKGGGGEVNYPAPLLFKTVQICTTIIYKSSKLATVKSGKYLVKETNYSIKGTVSVISSKDDNAQFTTLPLKPSSD